MFTTGDFFDLNLFTWIRNLTGGAVSRDKPIEFVSVNDLPLDDFIRENEMVITIATPYVGNDDRMYEFIDGLVKAKASIFLLAIPSDKIELSKRCRDHAYKNNLSVFQIPWEYRFADIIEKVTDEIRGSNNALLQSLEKCQNELLKCYLSGKEITAAQAIIASHLGIDVDIIKSKTPYSKPDIPADYSEILLKQNGKIYGTLYIHSKITFKTKSLISRTLAPVLMLWFYKEDIIQATQHMVRDDFIWELIGTSSPLPEEMLYTAETLDLNIEKSFTCIVGQINFLKQIPLNSWLNTNMGRIREILQLTAASLGRETILTSQKNMLVMFIENSTQDKRKNINLFLDKAEENIAIDFPSIYFSWGISEIKNGSTDFKSYFVHAKLAKELSANSRQYTKNHRYSYEETLIFDMLSVLSADKYILSKAYNIISPLLQYDKDKNTNLMSTLRAYLHCRNISKAAESINMHRQTFIYQLNKIEDLLDLSLKDSEALFLLEICMRLHVDFKNIN